MPPSNYQSFTRAFKDQLLVGRFTRRLLLPVVLIMAVASLAGTGVLLFSDDPFGPNPQTLLVIVLFNIVFLLVLGAYISWKVTGLWIARRKGSIGSRLQTRIVVMFSLVAVIPTVIVVVFSISFFNLSLQSWFDDRVSTALSETSNVADAYLREHRATIRADALAMANDVSRSLVRGIKSEEQFKQLLNNQALFRNLVEAVAFQKSKLLAKTDMSYSLLMNYADVKRELLSRADKGEVVILTEQEEDRVRALIKIPNTYDTYLLVGRFIDARVLAYTKAAKGSAREYVRLKQGVGRIQLQFSLVFAGVALLLLLLTIWFGMAFASELVKPVSELVAATDRVRAGDLQTTLKERPENDEVGYLGRAFNRMVEQLRRQRNELMEANRKLDDRRQFTEAVLANLTAGVLVLDGDDNVNLCNHSAQHVLGIEKATLEAHKIDVNVPDMMHMLENLRSTGRKTVQGEVHVAGARALTLLVRMAALPDKGVVIAFDDISELKSAERRAAWADVARRVAHEIKNPLTPIQLSTERLRTKYAKQVKEEDREAYVRYVDTIMRHAEDIRQMVESFVDYARMPQPEFRPVPLQKMLNASAFTFKVAHPKMKLTLELPKEPVLVLADERQMTRAIDNLLKNAAEAMPEDAKSPKITVSAVVKDHAQLLISDNGPGFRADILAKATEPYVTSKEKGTGLGLAIVQKIMHDHDAHMECSNITNSEGDVLGACVSINLALS